MTALFSGMMSKLNKNHTKYQENTMALSILTNTAALNAQANLSKTNPAFSNSLSRLSSGLRISSQDDAAGFAIARRLQADSAAQMSTRESALGLSQSLEGGLQETQDVLIRMQDLAHQSLNGSNSAADLDMLNAEFTQLKDHAGQMANTSRNGESWFVMGAGAPKSITVGGASLDQSRVALIGSSDPEDGILTRSYDGVSFSSDAFDISGASSKEQREGVLNALNGMLSGVRTAQHAVGTFQGEVIPDVSARSMAADLALYTPADVGDWRNKLERNLADYSPDDLRKGLTDLKNLVEQLFNAMREIREAEHSTQSHIVQNVR